MVKDSAMFIEAERSKDTSKQKLKGLVVCDCWCHESGSKDDVCTKCLSRIGEGKEHLSS
jgi:hypothetical protein